MKTEILELATKQMRDGGFDTLSFRGIAEQLGVSKANIHHHFKNKETLALEVMESYSNEMLKGLQHMAQECQSDLAGFIDAIETFFWTLSRESGHCSVCVCEQVSRVSDSPDSMKEMSQEFSREFHAVVLGVVERSAADGRLRANLDPEQVANQIMMMMSGLCAMARSKPTVADAERTLGGTLQSWAQTLIP